jgi:hypothetical protein
MVGTNDPTTRGASTLWIVLLTVASTVTTLVLACATPFPALAALAAVQMRRADGVALIGAAWLASQVVGFGFLHYPHSASTIGWAAAIGIGAVASVLAASAMAARVSARGFTVSLVTAYVAGFVAFKATIFVASLGLGGGMDALSLKVIVAQFARNAAILVGLLLLYRALTALGLPAATLPRQAVGA